MVGLLSLSINLQQGVVLNNFATRLLEACNASDEIPDYGKGQQTEIAARLNVSQEAVRKWLAGETVPRSAMSKRLAELLGVKHSWLMLGTAHGEIEVDIRLARRHKACVYAVMSYVVGAGKGATFSDEEAVDDITLIDGGRLLRVSVEMADRPSEGFYEVKFSEPQKNTGVTVAVVAEYQTQRSATMDALEIDEGIWKKHGKLSGRELVLRFEKSARGNTYSVGGTKIRKFLE